VVVVLLVELDPVLQQVVLVVEPPVVVVPPEDEVDELLEALFGPDEHAAIAIAIRRSAPRTPARLREPDAEPARNCREGEPAACM
jgi:hypothetical protein